jgi:hypothetical protein
MSSVQPRCQAGTSVEKPCSERIGRAVGVDPHHQRRVAAVAEARAGDVAVAVAEVDRRPGARHRHAVPAPASRAARDAIASATGASPAPRRRP